MKKKENGVNKRRINVVLSKEDYERFKILAKDELRSMTNFASILVRRHIQEAWNKRESFPN